MKKIALAVLGLSLGASIFLASKTEDNSSYAEIESHNLVVANSVPKGCVFNTLFGIEKDENPNIFNTPDHVLPSIDEGIDWLLQAQQENGAWGAGLHSRQNVTDPHAVATDPATTAMVGMALLRSGYKLESGKGAKVLQGATDYLIKQVAYAPANQLNITEIQGTQIQAKLGGNIDVVLAAQFFSNLLTEIDEDSEYEPRVRKALEECVGRIERAQDQNGSTRGAGWAGVLQSAFANNALESAQSNGVEISEELLEKSRDYQQQNYDASTGRIETSAGAGVMLYSVSGSTRASAKEARRARETYEDAVKSGKLSKKDELNAENLQKAGLSEDEALKATTAYEVYESAKVQAQDERVINGFGSNGGEEFLSFLQTGESLVINQDDNWKGWYDATASRLLTIQNDNGSWSGHHCITSPVFCTATCLLILSINNDIETLSAVGEN